MDELERWKPAPDAPRVTPGHIRNLEQIATLLNSQFGRGLHTRSGFYLAFSTPPQPCPTCGQVQDIIGYSGDHLGENWQPLQDCATFEHGIGLSSRQLVAIWFDNQWQLRPTSSTVSRAGFNNREPLRTRLRSTRVAERQVQ